MKELKEKNFIHEQYAKDPWPFWRWLMTIAFFAVFAFSMRACNRSGRQEPATPENVQAAGCPMFYGKSLNEAKPSL